MYDEKKHKKNVEKIKKMIFISRQNVNFNFIYFK